MLNSSEKMSGLSVVVVGDSKCGKTQLINRFANAAFDQVGFASSLANRWTPTQLMWETLVWYLSTYFCFM